MKKALKIFGVVMAVIAIGAAAVLYYPGAVATQAATAPSVGVTFDGVGGQLYLSSSGPITEDFQVKLCFNNSDGWPSACATSPWASAAGAGGTWSTWQFPGQKDEMQYASISIVNTRALPAGETLNNVQLGLELAEDNAATLAGTSNNLPIDYCIQQFTPYGGGWSPTAYSYTYGDNCQKSPSNTPDDFRFFLGATLGKRVVTMSSNIPSPMTTGQSVTSQITVNNNGTAPLTASSWTFKASGAGTGNCDIDTDGDGIKDAPDPSNAAYLWKASQGTPPPTYKCSVPGTATASDLVLTHSGQFTTPTTVLYSLSVSKISSYTPAYTENLDSSDPGGPTNCGTGPAKSLLMGLIPKAYAVACGSHPIVQRVPAYSWTDYSQLLQIAPGKSGVFNVPLTAPGTPGSYPETWTLSDSSNGSLGAIPGGTYTKTITVTSGSGGTATLNVASKNRVTGGDVVGSWGVFGPVTKSSDSKTADSYASLPPGTYNVIPGTAAGFTLNAIRGGNIAKTDEGSVLSKIFAAARGVVGEPAFASTNVSAYVCAQTDAACLAGTGAASASQTLSAGDTKGSTIEWYPLATGMTVSPTTLALDGTGKGSFNIQNNGMPGSKLDWTATTADTWFTLSATSGGVSNGASQQGASGASQAVTITASPSLAAGPYSGTITINGVSDYCPSSPTGCTPYTYKQSVSISFTKSTQPASITKVTVSCTPGTTVPQGTSHCSATVTGTGSYSGAVTWSVTNGVGSIDANGNYTAPNATGVANVQAVSVEDPSKSGTGTVTVSTAPTAGVTSVAVSVTPVALHPGQTANAIGTVTYSDGSTDNNVTYSSDNPSIATVDPNTGLVTAKTVGTAHINATSKVDPTKSASAPATVTVTPTPTVTSISMSVTPDSIAVGGTATAKATIKMSDGTTNSDATYSSENTGIASVDPTTGKVTGISNGIATIKGTSNANPAMSATAQVAVGLGGGGGGGSVTVTAVPTTIAKTETATCIASVAGTSNTNVVWSSTNGTISGSGSTVTLVPTTAPTTATCLATLVSNGASGSANVTVTSSTTPLNEPTSSLSASPTSLIVPEATTLTYHATHVSSCMLSGGGFQGGAIVSVDPLTQTASGSTVDNPTSDQVYTLTCYGTNTYTSVTTTVKVTVKVTGPGRVEGNPGGN